MPQEVFQTVALHLWRTMCKPLGSSRSS